MRHSRYLLVVGLALTIFFVAASSAIAQQDKSQESNIAETPEQFKERMDWWKKGKFGMFIHWGIYSQSGGQWGEETNHGAWLQLKAKIPLAEYTEYAKSFNPVKFDADQWVQIAKDAGMKYIVITSKHHDGFAMYESACNDHNIVKGTKFARDPLKELAAACKRGGIRFCVYYSLGRDWQDPDVPTPRARRSNLVDFPDEDKKVFAKYFERKAKPQVRELLTELGPLGILWFDTPGYTTPEQSEELYTMIRTLQPKCIVNKRVDNGFGDYGTSEQHIPDGFGVEPWETCMTMNNHWSYNRADHKWRPVKELIRNLVDISSKDGNFLLNVGPTGEGVIPQESVDRLQAVGKWMKINGDSVYETEGVPGEQPKWGRLTMRRMGEKSNVYLNVFDWPGEQGKPLQVPLANQVKRCYALSDPNRTFEATTSEFGLEVKVSGDAPDEVSSVIVLELDDLPKTSAPRPIGQDDKGVIALAYDRAELIDLDGPPARLYSPDKAVGYWGHASSEAHWKFEVTTPGSFRLTAETSGPKPRTFNVSVGDQVHSVSMDATEGFKTYAPIEVESFRLDAGIHTIKFIPQKDNWSSNNLRRVKLIPIKE